MNQEFYDSQAGWEDETDMYAEADGYDDAPADEYEYLQPGEEWIEEPRPSPLASLFSNGPGPGLIALVTVVVCLVLIVGLASISGNAISAVNETSDAIATQSAQTAAQPQAGQAAADQAAVPADCAVSDLFPAKVRRWCGLITQYAQKHQLSPDLVTALIWLESGGDEVAYSRSGAVGLMQVMPSDGPSASFMCVNGPCFSDRPTTAQLQDPEFNIAYGTRMLAGLISKNGDLREALKSYGPINYGYTYADKVLGIFQKYKK